MTVPAPKLRVLGVYSSKAAWPEYNAFLNREVASQNPINFSEETKAFLKRVGRGNEIVELSPEELLERRNDLDRELSTAVLVEILVENPDSNFTLGAFTQQRNNVPSGQWQVAWCEKFLATDGERLLGEYSYNEVPTDQSFRVVFYVHNWVHECGLHGPYGPMVISSIQPMPERLWRLAPYEVGPAIARQAA